jgi:hypothetical protein
VVLDQRHVLRREELDQALLRRVRHRRADRIGNVRHHQHRFHRVLGERELERLERDAAPRVRRDLERAQAEALQDLQEAVEGRRFQRDQIAGLRHRAQAQVDRLDAAGSGDEVAMVDAAAPLQRTARHRAAQLLGAWRKAVASERIAVAARNRGKHAAHALELEELRRGARRAERHDIRIARVGEHEIGELVHLDRQRALRRPRRLGLAHCSGKAPHVVARLRPRLDDADILQALIRLQHRRHADALLVGKPPHRRHAVARAQRPGADQLMDLVGKLVVERGSFEHSTSSQGGCAAPRHSCRQRQP